MAILEEVDSPTNGKLTVVRDLGWGTYIQGGGLTQSGGIAEKVWQSSLKAAQKKKSSVNQVLLLGLGGAGIVKVIKKNWPEAKITGVDIDPVIVELGRKYLGLKEAEVQIQIQDALTFLKKSKDRYDLILVDIYVGDSVPEKFLTLKFYQLVKKALKKDGVAVFNRLYFDEKRQIANQTEEKLKKVFSRVEVVFPEVNIMFLCSNG